MDQDSVQPVSGRPIDHAKLGGIGVSTATAQEWLKAIPFAAALADADGTIKATNHLWCASLPVGSGGEAHLDPFSGLDGINLLERLNAYPEMASLATGFAALARGDLDHMRERVAIGCLTKPQQYLVHMAIASRAPVAILINKIEISGIEAPLGLGIERAGAVICRTETPALVKATKQATDFHFWCQTLADNLPEAAIIFDHDLRCLMARGQGLSRVGLERATTEGKTIFEIFPGDVVERLEPAIRAALAGSSDEFEQAFAARIHRVTAVPIRDDRGDVIAGLCATADITGMRQAESDARQAAYRIREAEESARLKDVMVSSGAHQLGNLLHTALLAFDLAIMELDNGNFSAVQPILSEGEGAIRKLNDTLKRMQRLVKLEQGQAKLALARDNTAQFLGRVARDLANYAEGRSVEVVVGQSDTTTVLADLGLLSEAVRNLMHNGIKFSTAGGRLKVDAVQPYAQALDIRVTDNGPGVPDAEKLNIFQPFYQTPEVRKGHSGSGLGLALVTRIARLHGGNAWVEDNPAGGSVFILRIPQT